MFKKVLLIFSLLFSQSLLAADEVLDLNATFQVPVPSEKFAHLANFEITNYQIITNSKGVITMAYTLPEDLSGEQITIVLPLISDNNGNRLFKGEKGSADCTGEWASLECGVRFENLNIQQGKVITHLFAKYGYNQETKNRMLVSQMFAKNPTGLLKTNGTKE
ncbi:hypothetical protein [Pseudobdellovibrio sp. HCB154]|uniref:hypothetical protein n=1 Tax=Pseudobdellovibrio sp. HCB154 TaxID=3386277 RepID=UPI00391703B8